MKIRDIHKVQRRGDLSLDGRILNDDILRNESGVEEANGPSLAHGEIYYMAGRTEQKC
jgi:hypothetical protein